MKLIYLFIFLLLFYFNNNVAQEKKLIFKGQVVAASTEDPISYVNIFVLNTEIGTISGEDGKFELSLEQKDLNDTIIFSSIGYKPYIEKIENLSPRNNLFIELDDSLFLLNEVVAIAYDYIDIFNWKTKKDDKTKMLLSFSTRNIGNVSNYINLLKEAHGYTKLKGNSLKWKRIDIPEIKEKADYHLTFFKCPYCPDDDNISVTIEVTDRRNNNLAENSDYQKALIRHFQFILDKTFSQGIDNNQLANKNGLMYFDKDTVPYTGKCFGYFENGQKGLRGEYLNGLREGYWEFWYSNGNKKIEGVYKEGIKNGKWIYWFTNGNKRMEANYIMDKMDGLCHWYFENGQMKKEAKYDNGIYLEKTEWDEKGRVVEATHYVR